MKVIFTADIHLSLTKDKDFEINRFLSYADTLATETADVVVLGGDIFDTAKPSIQEVALFYDFVGRLSSSGKTVYVIAGNHEYVGDGQTVFNFLPAVGFTYIEKGDIKIKHHVLRFVSHHKIESLLEDAVPINTTLFSHIRCDGAWYKAEIPFKFAPWFSNVFLGDIHIPHAFDNVKYSGQPYSTNYDIVKKCGYYVIDFSKKTVVSVYKDVELPSRIKFSLEYSELPQVLHMCGTTGKRNFYKIFVTGTLEQLNKLPKMDNVIFVPTVVDAEIDLEERVEELKIHGRLDIHDTLLQLSKEMFELPDTVVDKGVAIMEGIRIGKN